MAEHQHPDQAPGEVSVGQNEYAQLTDSAEQETESQTQPTPERTVNYSGVELVVGTGGERFVPPPNPRYIDDPFSRDLQQRLATGFKLHQPVLIEGGTSLGKSTTCQKMAADLGWSYHYSNNTGSSEVENMMGSYVPNPHRTSPTEAEFVFADGPVTAAVREAAEGHRVMLVIDELNSTAPNILIRLHEVIDAYEKSGILALSEDANEKLNLVRENLHIVGLTNPPSRAGSQYLQREALDPAMIRRWVYQKLPDQLPAESMEYATQAMFGLKPDVVFGDRQRNLPTAEHETPHAELGQIPGMDEILPLYIEFHRSANDLLLNRRIAGDQPQRFTFDDREEPRRVMEFVRTFYRGDLNETFQAALEYFYAGKLLEDQDKESMTELIKTVHYVPRVESRRRGPEQRTTTGIEAWSASTAIQDKLVINIRDLAGFRDQINHAVAMEAIAGLDSPEARALKRQLALDKLVKPDNVGRMLAGDKSDEAWILRQQLESQHRWLSLGESLVGLDEHRAEVMRQKLHRTGTKESNNGAIIGLAGLDGERAWSDRKILKNYASLEAFTLSLTGLQSEEAWKARNDPALLTGMKADALGTSLAGLNSSEAWQLREKLARHGLWSALSLSLAGLNTGRAWDVRLSLQNGEDMDPTDGFSAYPEVRDDDTLARWEIALISHNPTVKGKPSAGELAQSVGGLLDEDAEEFRQTLKRAGAHPSAIAKGYYGNWIMAGVMLSQR